MKEKVYMIAIGGVGMSALTYLFREDGFDVCGSDRALYPPVSEFLEGQDIEVFTPFSGRNIPGDIDFVVVGNAVTKDNPESAEVRRRGLRSYSLPSALHEFFIRGKESVVVAGTHGKTTTTSMVAHLLEGGGFSPSYFVGGIPLNFGFPARLGEGEFFVVEGDEYDSAYFDKRAKFFHYAPRYLILTSLEFDHADIYGSLDELKSAFVELARLVPGDGLIIYCSDYPGLAEAVSGAGCRVISYSTKDKGADIFVGEVTCGKRVATCPMSYRGETFELSLSVPGRFNMANGAASVVLADALGLPLPEALKGITSFSGVRRRQEFLGHPAGVTVVDDFAHHPTAVAETVTAIRDFYSPGRLISIFEPRSNTSRRNIFEERFAGALSLSDVSIVCPPHNPDAIEEPERFSPERVCAAMRSMGKEALTFGSLGEIPPYLAAFAKEGDLLLFMSNGGMGGIQGETLKLLEEKIKR